MGPDFYETRRRVPYETIITQTEKICSVIRNRGKEGDGDSDVIHREISEFRYGVKEVLEKKVKLK